MVARQDGTSDAERRSDDVAGALFARWRTWLSAGVAGAREVHPGRVVAAGAAGFAPLGRALRRPADATGIAERRSLAVAGVVALAAGASLSLALAAPLGVPAAEAAIATAWTLAWAPLRLGILRAASPRLSTADVALAWAGGLLPAVFGVVDPLRLVALAASAWLTTQTLRAAGATAGEARRAVAWAFGAEVLAWVARWILSALLLYVLVR